LASALDIESYKLFIGAFVSAYVQLIVSKIHNYNQ